MKKRKLGIIGGSGLYKMDGFVRTRWKKIKTPWGEPSDEILIANYGKEEICFVPRHSRGHKINPSNIYILIASFYTNEAANLLKQRIITETPNYDINKLKIKKKTSKIFEVLSGPYKSINLLKNDYTNLKIFGFEELDIFINE